MISIFKNNFVCKLCAQIGFYYLAKKKKSQLFFLNENKKLFKIIYTNIIDKLFLFFSFLFLFLINI